MDILKSEHKHGFYQLYYNEGYQMKILDILDICIVEFGH